MGLLSQRLNVADLTLFIKNVFEKLHKKNLKGTLNTKSGVDVMKQILLQDLLSCDTLFKHRILLKIPCNNFCIIV